MTCICASVGGEGAAIDTVAAQGRAQGQRAKGEHRRTESQPSNRRNELAHTSSVALTDTACIPLVANTKPQTNATRTGRMPKRPGGLCRIRLGLSFLQHAWRPAPQCIRASTREARTLRALTSDSTGGSCMLAPLPSVRRRAVGAAWPVCASSPQETGGNSKKKDRRFKGLPLAPGQNNNRAVQFYNLNLN